MSLTLTGGAPTFTEVTEPQLDADELLTQAILQAINADSNWAAVAVEDFWGYYKPGETVALPVSPADGYEYTRSELLYCWEIFSTGAPPATALMGTQAAPTPGPPSGPGQILAIGFSVDQATGYVGGVIEYAYVQYSTEGSGLSAGQAGGGASSTPEGVYTVSYYVTNGVQTNTQDGILMVRTLARRLSINPTESNSVAYQVGGQIVVTSGGGALP